jgi:methylmalonyl-CoA/ethylmalonyl-CoA epimerase
MTSNLELNQLIGNSWKFHHLGVVVRDLEKAYEQYKAVGLGNDSPKRIKMEGKKASLIGMLFNIGPVMIEMWQPVRGETIQQDFLDKAGDGVNHICFSVDDIEKERTRLTEQGIRIVFSSKTEFGDISYFDTRNFCNLALELVQPPTV